MAHIILFDNEIRDRLLPLTFTRPVCELRVGILTIREKWERGLAAPSSFITQDYLSGKFGMDYGDDNYFINGSALPSPELLTLIRQMDFNEAFLLEDELIAARLNATQLEKLMKDDDIDQLKGIPLQETPFLKVRQLTDLYRLNAQAIVEDMQMLTRDRKSAPLSGSNFAKAKDQIFLEEGAIVEGAFLNATAGPIYIGPDAEVMEGSLIRGPVAIGQGAQVKMGARLYGGTTIGPWCKVGGEVMNSVLLGYANKAHDGFLGHAYLGEWTNLGADTNTSNLKNNYDQIRLWSYPEERFTQTGTQFCGAILGDHSKTAINVSLNTGTVIGVNCNIFGAGFPRNFIPSFTWGGPDGFKTYPPDKAFEAMERVMERRNKKLGIEDRLILLRVFEDEKKHRHWERHES